MESEEDLRAMTGCFVEVCKGRGLKVIIHKRKELILNGEERLACEVLVNGMRTNEACQNLNTWGVIWMNRVQMRQYDVGRW